MQTSTEPGARAPNPILAVFGRALENALNHGLDLDPDTQAALHGLDGRAVTLTFAGTGLAMRVTVDGRQLRVGPAFGATSDLSITATPGRLLGMAIARLRGDEDIALPGRIEIAGDAELARRLERLASRFAPDFDEVFSRVFGDVAGFQIARALRRGLAFARTAGQGFLRDAADWLVEERGDVVARAELEGFLDQVDDLRERGDRLEARVRRLAGQRGT
ncbi:MAG TPA: SCP2 sterol-binding domain-containing protein [Dokdonella sp.]|uniref:ubiquinone biosynthesis accessory factor UbiJ n=1 Tax=Dokdonella sp. TaxID=2291710 RepID=UPI0025BA960D|nr:SCP2 sterol-binding domain-containing protein [Dokdonella sp.]MBX3691360.1 SCP2 sterol-binding domain-containing protein [Dokdonella sp.]MCW5567735.1 SCP2 sterol-binding domain-containing protein [Dokdonella sp.]HNR90972.1 SCP2 sterol-binding domain-containing protein [Dokdonella sp.]